MASSAPGALMIAGSALFLVGAGVAVPRVFTEPDPEEEARLLTERLWWWRLGQPLYAVGALAAALGVGSLAKGEATSATWLAASGTLLVVGALAWSWSVYRRAVRRASSRWDGCPGGRSRRTSG